MSPTVGVKCRAISSHVDLVACVGKCCQMTDAKPRLVLTRLRTVSHCMPSHTCLHFFYNLGHLSAPIQKRHLVSITLWITVEHPIHHPQNHNVAFFFWVMRPSLIGTLSPCGGSFKFCSLTQFYSVSYTHDVHQLSPGLGSGRFQFW